MKLKNRNFVIIANNCWGAEIYKWLKREYNTPFVGLFLYGPCYIRLLENFETLIKVDLIFKNVSKYFEGTVNYPIGCINEIEIHFVHYKSIEEAKTKWNRRLERMLKELDYNNYYFKICDREQTDIGIFKRFHDLPFKNKISFGINNYSLNNHIIIKENENNKYVPEGISLYRISFKYIDIIKWIRKGKKTKSLLSKIKVFFSYTDKANSCDI